MKERNELIHEMMQAISKGYADSYTKMFPLKSLHIFEHKRKYEVGNQVVIENGKLVKQNDEVPTHEITLLEGTLTDSKHSITLNELSTGNTLKIDL